jgi:hypothetical protein
MGRCAVSDTKRFGERSPPRRVTTPDAIDVAIRVPEGLRNPDAMQTLFAEHDSHVDGPALV